MSFKPKFETLNDIFRASTKAFSDRPLFGEKKAGRWQWLTYGQFAKHVDEVRGGLAALGVGKGDRVAVISNNRSEWAIGAYATYGLGAQYVPMYESQLDKDWKFILNNCGACAVVVANEAICDRVQGFYICPPVVGERIVPWVKKWEEKKPSIVVPIKKDS